MSGTDLVTVDQVLDLVARAMDDHDHRTAQAIALALRTYQPRRQTPSGSVSVAMGTVQASYDGYCDVLLDGDTASAPVATFGAVAVGTRVPVMHLPPAGAIVLGVGDGSGAVSTGAGQPVAMWELPGPVIPVAAEDSANIPIVTNGTIGGVMLSLDEAPATGMSLVVDVFLNGTSLYPITKPTLAAGATFGHFALPSAQAVVAFTDVLTAAVTTPAGRTLVIAVS